MGNVVKGIGNALGLGGDNISENLKSPTKLIGNFSPALGQVSQGLNLNAGGGSWLDAGTGRISVSPGAQNTLWGSLKQFRSNLGETRNSLLGNQGAYINAIVRPTLERLAAGRGQLQRTLGQTNVRGTLANNALQQYDINAARAEGDARAQATEQTLNAVTQLDQLLYNAGTGTATTATNKDLAALGLSAQTIQNLRSIASNLATGSGSNAISASGTGAQVLQQAGQNLLGAIGTGLGAYGALKPPAP